MSSRPVAVVAALLLGAAITGCSSGAAIKDSPGPSWAAVRLPSDVRPTSLGADQDVIVGGRQGNGPWLAMINNKDRVRSVPLKKISPYAFSAEFVSIATYRGKLAALGNVHGGAHGNSRWTVWTGTRRGLVEYPQILDTFGGVNGGDLEAVVINKDGPLITGSYRFGDSGLDGGIWLPDGTPVGKRWRQPDPTGTDLDTTRSVLVSVQTAAADHDQVVLAGSTTHLDNGVHQVASTWLRPDGTTWKRIELPGAGKRSEVLSAGCWSGDAGGLSCLFAGTVDGRLGAWTLVGTDAEPISLPRAAVDAERARPAAIGSPNTRAIAFDTGSGTGLMYETAGHWSEGVGPAGRLVSAVGYGQRAYVITDVGGRRALSRAELPEAR